LQVAEAALARTRLMAPFAGTVAEVNGELGEFVTPSPVGIPTPPAIDLIDTSCLYVLAPIDEVDAPEIRAGMPARILLDAFGKEHFEGAVRRVAPYVLDREQQARTVDVEVDFLDAGEERNLLPGYSADIEVILERHDDTLRIPSETLLEGLRVYVYDPDSRTIQSVQLEIGLSNWQHTEVRSGLREGQRIVRSLGREGLEDGARVRVEEQDGAATR
jgi:HlyD family secretion protein